MGEHQLRSLGPEDAVAYQALLGARRDPLVYHGLAYQALLADVTGGQPAHQAAWRGDRLVGALLAFHSPDRGAGIVANSLPYYGSHGGPVLDPSLPEDEAHELAAALTEAFFDAARKAGCLSATVVEALGARLPAPEADCIDERIGQVTRLPEALAGGPDDDALMAAFHGKTRNAIRKARKEGVQVRLAEGPEERAALRALHVSTMERLGAEPKSDRFFDAVDRHFGAEAAPIQLAHVGGELVAALLVLRGGGWAEYFVPATRPEARSLQPMSVLVHEAMRAAVEQGDRHFNFGGTWLAQTDVHRFKARFAARDQRYHYWTRLFRPRADFRSLGAKGLLAAFPGFFVLPFAELGP